MLIVQNMKQREKQRGKLNNNSIPPQHKPLSMLMYRLPVLFPMYTSVYHLQNKYQAAHTVCKVGCKK